MTISRNLCRRSLLSIIDFHPRSRAELRIRIRIRGKSRIRISVEVKNQIKMRWCWLSENIEVFIEGQSFSPSYDLAFPQRATHQRHKTEKERQLVDGSGGRKGGGGAKPNDGEKASSSINHVILSASSHWRLYARSQISLVVIVHESVVSVPYWTSTNQNTYMRSQSRPYRTILI